MSIGFTLAASLNSGSPNGVAGATPGTGSRRRHGLVVYFENSGAIGTCAVSKGGVAGTPLANEDIGTTTVNGIHVYVWSEAQIASMSGTALSVTSGTYPSASGYAEFTLQDCAATDLTYGQGTNGGTNTLNADTPNPPTCDLAIALATMSTNAIRVDSTSAVNFVAGEVFDADTGGSALGAWFATHGAYSTAQLNLALSGTTTRGQVIVLGFTQDTTTGGGARLPRLSLLGAG